MYGIKFERKSQQPLFKESECDRLSPPGAQHEPCTHLRDAFPPDENRFMTHDWTKVVI